MSKEVGFFQPASIFLSISKARSENFFRVCGLSADTGWPCACRPNMNIFEDPTSPLARYRFVLVLTNRMPLSHKRERLIVRYIYIFDRGIVFRTRTFQLDSIIWADRDAMTVCHVQVNQFDEIKFFYFHPFQLSRVYDWGRYHHKYHMLITCLE